MDSNVGPADMGADSVRDDVAARKHHGEYACTNFGNQSDYALAA